MSTRKELLVFLANTLFFGIPIGSTLNAADAPDSSRQFIGKEVIVTATRLSQDYSRSSSSVTIIEHAQLGQSGQGSVASAIARSTGVFIKDYGASSGIKLISQRGMGSEHTVILLNGQRVSLFQNGLMDLGILPSDDLERIEIVRGGQSALFGADAVAGVLNLVTRRPGLDSSLRATVTVGSFGSRKVHLFGGTAFGRFGLSGGFSHEQSDENFPFQFHNGNLTYMLRRTNADVDSRFGYLQAGMNIGERSDLTVFASGYNSERGAGGQVVAPSSISNSRQVDRDNIIQVSYRTGASSSTTVFSNVQLHHFYERYQDPDLIIGRAAVDNYFTNREVRVEPRVEHVFNKFFRFTGGGEIIRVAAEGNSLKGKITRSQFGIYLASENTLLAHGGMLDKITVYPAVRYDAFSSSLNSVSPQCGIVMEFEEWMNGPVEHIRPVLRLNVGKNFRVPTFNELYYGGEGGRGNPDLSPERATSLDAGGNISFYFLGEHFLQASYFVLNMADRIVWLPAGNIGVMPKNIAKVRSQGIELFYRLRLYEEMISFETNYTNGSSIKISEDKRGDPSYNKQLIYIPQEMMNVSLSVTQHHASHFLEEIGASLAHQFISYRFYSADNTEFLPSYSIMNASLRSRARVAGLIISARCEIHNIFNSDYQVIIGYPMPMRSYSLTIGAEY